MKFNNNQSIHEQFVGGHDKKIFIQNYRQRNNEKQQVWIIRNWRSCDERFDKICTRVFECIRNVSWFLWLKAREGPDKTISNRRFIQILYIWSMAHNWPFDNNPSRCFFCTFFADWVRFLDGIYLVFMLWRNWHISKKLEISEVKRWEPTSLRIRQLIRRCHT